MNQTLRADSSSTLPTGSFFENRRKLPAEELAKHKGKWIAISRDGTHIVASAPTPKKLIKRLAIARKGPEDVILGRVGSGETILGGADLL
ncbi:MAG TPA: DUF5678 domain-containing protein [Gemmataceae bacterium]|nr:DUF5678 domain-containing protein [Gemmataceae bacterium]